MRDHLDGARWAGTLATVLLLAAGTAVWGGQARATFLEPGVGVRGRVEIGRAAPGPGARAELRRDFGLQFREQNGVVLIVYCAADGCVTRKNVGVGSTRSTIYLRYGKPLEIQPTPRGELLKYRGLAFEVGDRQTVTCVFVYPVRG